MFLALLPVRNGENDLDDWFDSVDGVVDGVLALDDGSTDGTLRRLRAHASVRAVLTNPVRPDETGWDDRDNRQRLLDLAVAEGATWVLWLDADERIPAADGRLLRAFALSDADPDEAYGFGLFDQVAPGRYAPGRKWVYRLHSVRAGDRYPERRLHFPPVPTRIPRGRWLRTSLRMLHVGMATPTARRRRFEKYERVDPDRHWQASYDHLLEPPLTTRALPERVGDEVLLGVHEGPPGRPDLSVVIIAHRDRDTIDEVIDSVTGQEVDASVEVVVVVSGDDGTAARVGRRDDVRLVDLGPTVTPGAARNAAREHVSGDFVVFVGSHVRLLPGSLAARFAAHRRGWAMVTGPLVDGSASAAGRAAFFLDHVMSPPSRPRALLHTPPPRCSYVRFALDRVDWFPDVRAGEDTEVNHALFGAGFRAGFEPDAVEAYVADVADRAALRSKHEERGRALRRIRLAAGDDPPRFAVGYTTRRVRRIVAAGLRHPQRSRFLRSLPSVVGAILAARRGYVGRA